MKIIILFMLITQNFIYSQACCTAGTPLLGSLEMAASDKGNFKIGVSFEINKLKDVYNNDIEINDLTRERISSSYLIEGDYGFSNRFSIAFLFSNITQERIIRSAINESNKVKTRGVGDAIFLIKYKVLIPTIVNNSLTFGIGVKLPFGSSDIKHQNILLPADMQPGSGSIDYIFWSQYVSGFRNHLPLSLILNLSYKYNESSKRFSNSNDQYRFGNILQFISGIGYRTDYFFDISLLLKIRHSSRDKFNNVEISNTGGTWFYLMPGINLTLLKNITSRFASEIPVYRFLDGTQLTTSYKLKFSLYYKLKF